MTDIYTVNIQHKIQGRKMKKTQSIPLLAALLAAAVSAASCSKTQDRNSAVKITNWNVQTFFDAHTDGTEYQEFVKSSGWGKEAYEERLRRLCAAIKSLDSDVIAMEELENEKVLYDISNFLAGEWNSKKVYRYACFAKERGNSIGCGILSRHPLTEMKLHSLDIRSENEKMPRMRPLMEVTLCCAGRNLCIFVNHWKSKSGGEEATEKWRNRAESQLAVYAAQAVQNGFPVLMLGDFNRDIHDFCILENKAILLRTMSNGTFSGGGTEAEALWFFPLGRLAEPGSYYFRGEWSRIDNMFLAGNIQAERFFPETDGPWCQKETFIPYKYSLWNKKGYSDHLPISCIVRFQNQ